ncbi:hypothetical protein Tco_1508920 [Tanacetum coccineum]
MTKIWSFQIEEDSDELDTSRVCFSAGAFCTQRKVSMVSFGRISPNRNFSFSGFSVPIGIVGIAISIAACALQSREMHH